MAAVDYFKGIAVIIDDEVEVPGTNIFKLVDQIKQNNIPCYTSKLLPENSVIQHFENASFLILDWKLKHPDMTAAQEGVILPDTIDEDIFLRNIEFLKLVLKTFFAPIFIFTDDDTETVINKLKEHNLYQEDKPNVIFVKNKIELTQHNNLLEEIEQWIRQTPSIYVLKEWERAYQGAKNHMFQDFYERSPFWPEVLWKAYEDDGVNSSRELSEVITRNLYSRISPFHLNSDLIKTGITIDTDELRCVLEGERFIKNNQLSANDIFTGDIYKIGTPSWSYLLNIRAQCDLVREPNPKLYCLKGRIITDKLSDCKNDHYEFKQGQFIEKNHQAIVSCIDGGQFVEFSFRELEIKTWNSVKEHRIGRLLPPYITRIQQLYSLYFQRIGLPRTPDVALPLKEANEVTATATQIIAEAIVTAAATSEKIDS